MKRVASRFGLGCCLVLLFAMGVSAQELVPPRLLEGGELVLPEGTPPLTQGAQLDLELVIDPAGAVTEVSLLTPLREDVDPLVVAAAHAMRFAPATRDGTPIPARIRFRFLIPAAPEEAPAVAETETETEVEAEPQPPSPPPEQNEEDEEPFVARAEVERPEPGAASRVTLRAEELTTVPGTFGEPLRVVATLPGVARSPYGLGFFVVRGASFENTGFLVDGFPVPLLYHLGAGPAVISSRLVTALDFYPGGYPVRYGRFSAGLISLTTGPPPADRVHFETEVDFFRASALAVVPFDEGRGVISAAVRRSYYELLLPLIIDDLSVSFGDWQVRADYRFGSRLTGSLFYFGSQDALDQSQAAGAGVSGANIQTALSYGFHRLIGKLALRLPEDARLTWAGSLGLDATEFHRIDPGGTTLRGALDGIYLGQRAELSVPFGEAFTLSVGADVAGTLYRAQSTLPAPPGFGDLPKPVPDFQTAEIEVRTVQIAAAAYAEGALRLGPVETTLGLRLDRMHYADVERFEFDPRLVVRYQTTADLTLKAATGLFMQSPQAFQIDRTFGAPDLRPQRSFQSSVGAELLLPLGLEAQSTAFYNEMSRIARSTTELVPDGMGGVRRQLYRDDGQGRSYGLEFMLRRKVEDGLYGWVSYTLSWSERFLEGGQTVPFLFDQRHVLNIALSYKLGGWRFGARLTLATGRPERRIIGAIYDADADDYDAQRTGFDGRQRTYHQLDLRVDRDFTLGPITGSVYLDVLNAYYAQNSEGTLYQYDFQDSAPLPGLPIIPTLGLRMVWEP